MGNAMPSAPKLSIEEQRQVLNLNCSVAEVAERIRSGKIRNIVVMAGAGISCSCGIPDFRTPGTGLYDNLQRFNLPNPQAMFSIDFFRENPQPFFELAREMYPSQFTPSPTHAFFKLLHDKGLLLRLFTQNIDTLERAAGLPADALVEAHGSFAKAHCIDCGKEHEESWVKEQIFAGRVVVCTADDCAGLVKPDIVFFGESLPDRFVHCKKADMPKADLLIIAGTSLAVHPFAGLVHDVAPDCPRLLLNMEKVGLRDADDAGNGLRLDQTDNYRDVCLMGPCDDGVRALCDAIGWREELEALIETLKSRGGRQDNPVDVDAVFGAGSWTKNWRGSSGLPEEMLPFGEWASDTQQVRVDLPQEAPLHGGAHVPVRLVLRGDAAAKFDPMDFLLVAPVGEDTVPPFELDWASVLLGDPQDVEGEAGTKAVQRTLRLPRTGVCAPQAADDAAPPPPQQFELWLVSGPKRQIAARFGVLSLTHDEDGTAGEQGASAAARAGPTSVTLEQLQGMLGGMDLDALKEKGLF